ncbi:MAG: hypothetical protein ACK5PQ_00450 [Alphaproteobacteria bacterium]
MKFYTYFNFFMACFLYSWGLKAAYDDKKEATGVVRSGYESSGSFSEDSEDESGIDFSPLTMGSADEKEEDVFQSFPLREDHEGIVLSALNKNLEADEKEKDVFSFIGMPFKFSVLKAAKPFMRRPASPYSSPDSEGEEEAGVVVGASKADAPDFKDVLKDLAQNPHTLRGILRLSLNPFPMELIPALGQFKDAHTLSLDGISFGEKQLTSELMEALKGLPKLTKIKIVNSKNLENFLFFLGLEMRRFPHVTEIVLDRNTVGSLGVKGLFCGLEDMTHFTKISLRHLPLDRLLPWEVTEGKKTEGYKVETRVSKNSDGTETSTTYVWKTALGLLMEKLPHMEKLRHLDVTGSLKFKKDDPKSRDELMSFFDTLTRMSKLNSVGVGELKGDGFLIRDLSKALEKLYTTQCLLRQSEQSWVHILNVNGVLGEGATLKDLEKGLQSLHHLRRLYLADNQLTDADMVYLLKNILPHMKKLEVLHLGGNLNLTEKSLNLLKEEIEKEKDFHLKKVILGNQFPKSKIDDLRALKVHVHILK